METAAIVYLCIFLVGFVFLVGSLALGSLGGHAEAGDAGGTADAGAPHLGGDLSADQGLSPASFSVKLAACFLTGYGAGALVVHYWISPGLSPVAASLAEFGAGLAFGSLVAWFGWLIIKFLLSQQGGNEAVQVSEFVGVRATLAVAIREPSGIGEITFTHKGKRFSLDVRSEDGKAVDTGSEVEVVRVSGNTGIVRKCGGSNA